MRESAACSRARAAASSAEREHPAPEGPVQDRAQGVGLCVLLVTGERQTERSLRCSLARRRAEVELARSLMELERRLVRDDLVTPDVVFIDLELPDATGEDWVCAIHRSFPAAALVAFGDDLNAARAARLLGFGVPSLHKPVSSAAFARLAVELRATRARDPGGRRDAPRAGPRAGRAGGFELAIEAYASVRALSNQQRLILGFYLAGENDKQIAHTLSCSEATVYEHWRRMGKKAGGTNKSAVITDFHRFLVRD